MFGISVMGRNCNGFLLPTAVFEFFGEGFEHEGFHHRAPITEYVSTKRVNHFVPVGPCNCTMDGGFGNTVSTIIYQRLPSHFTARWNSFDSLA
jgi:hypothetical protein